jgi:MFS family permease
VSVHSPTGSLAELAPSLEALPSAVDTKKTAMTQMFSSLSYPQFRLFWLSNLIVAMGLMVQVVAQRWLVVQLTDSALLLGLVSGVWAVTFALSSVPLGLAADRSNRRNLLLIGSVAALAITLVIAILVAASIIEVWHVLAAGAIGGVLYALRVPAGQAMTARLVPPKELMNAISLNQTAHSLPSVAGPAAGGVLVGLIGVAGAYFLTSGVLFIGLLLMLGVAASFGRIHRTAPTSAGADLSEALDYLRSHKDLLWLTAAMLIPFILGQSYVLLLPLFVEKELGLGPVAFGALSACLGAGSVLGALSVAAFGKERHLGFLMFAGVIVTGVAAIVYGLSGSVFLVGAVLFAAGAGESALFAAYETVLLIRLPDELRGRVLGLMFTLVAMFPIGAVAAGGAADAFGLRAVAVGEGILIIPMAFAAWVLVFREASARCLSAEPA